jgi:four helix bundle protein
MKPEAENIILKLTLEFALDLIEYCELLESHKKFVISKQLLQAGTSIGANVREAQNAESKADFIHKMKIAAKEAGESEYWLTLCKLSKNYSKNEILIQKVEAIKSILGKIIFTAKTN